jgi:ariadne-1
MHMTCRKDASGCGHEFCWICLGNWKEHGSSTGGFYQCNRFVPETAVDADRAKTQRYLHFKDRFSEHEKAQRFASTDQHDFVTGLADKLVQHRSVSTKMVEFLGAAVDEVVQCRRFLKWTYVYAFLSELQKQRELFDFHQAQLEGTLERLSDVLESTDWGKYVDPAGQAKRPLQDVRAQVISLTDLVKKSRASLATAVQELNRS